MATSVQQNHNWNATGMVEFRETESHRRTFATTWLQKNLFRQRETYLTNLASLSLAWILLFSVFCVCWALDPALLSCFFCWTWISRICNSLRWDLSHLCHPNDISASHMTDPNFKHNKLRKPVRTLNGSPLKLHKPVSKMSDSTPGWVPDAMA